MFLKDLDRLWATYDLRQLSLDEYGRRSRKEQYKQPYADPGVMESRKCNIVVKDTKYYTAKSKSPCREPAQQTLRTIYEHPILSLQVYFLSQTL